MGLFVDATILVDERLRCADLRPEEALRERLPLFRSPTVLSIVVASREKGAAFVAHLSTTGHSSERTFLAKSHACSSLVRAVSAWATLLADDWGAEESEPPSGESGERALPTTQPPTSSANDELPTRVAEPEEHALPRRGVELGAGFHVSDGLGSGAFAGATASTALLFPSGVVLRGEIIGSASMVDLGATRAARWMSFATEACYRADGNYVRGSSLAVEGCAHVEPGVLQLQDPREATTLYFFSFGPSLALRGDLGEVFAVEARATTLIHAAKPHRIGTLGSREAPDLGVRGELSLTARAF